MRKIFKFHFTGADALMEGIKCVSSDLFFELADKNCADVIINVKNEAIKGLKVSLKENNATICYGERKSSFFRGLMLLSLALYEEKTSYEIEESTHFDSNGGFVDLARCNPLSIKGLEYFIRHSAIMGHNTLHFYLEDMFELPSRPLFGHQRGRYTKQQFKALTEYSENLGVELIPYIETLGHLEKYLKYHSTNEIRSSFHELLADEPKTYEFIEDMIKAVKEYFPITNVIGIGIDEARTINKGKYEAIHGSVDAEEIYYRHINKVCALANKHGLKPIIPCDMFFQYCWKGNPPTNGYYVEDNVTFTQKAIEGVPENTQLMFWNYSAEDEEKMVRLFEKHFELGDDIFYLGGVKMYQSLIAKYKKTLATITAGVPAAIRANVKDMALSMFEDTGETPHFFALPALLIVAEYDFGVGYNEEELERKLNFLYDVGFKPFVDMERADNIHDNDNMELATKFLLYNDPLFGLLDKNAEGLDLKNHYGQLVKDYENVNPSFGPMKLCFEQFKAMLSALELKADFGLRLKEAYDNKDKTKLQALADESLVIADRFRHFMDVDKELYTSYYRGFGLDVVEMRRATLRSRFETTHYMILKYLEGSLDKIEELENERRMFDYNPWENTCENIFFGEGFERIYSPNF